MFKKFIYFFTAVCFFSAGAYGFDTLSLLSKNTLAPKHTLTENFDDPDSLPLETDMLLRMFAFTEEKDFSPLEPVVQGKEPVKRDPAVIALNKLYKNNRLARHWLLKILPGLNRTDYLVWQDEVLTPNPEKILESLEEYLKQPFKETLPDDSLTLNLSEEGLDEWMFKPSLQPFREIKGIRFSGNSLYPMTRYEQKVLSLKQGDRIVFKDKTFTLGKFLGAGNTNHVFEVAGEEKVIKIPLLASPRYKHLEESRKHGIQYTKVFLDSVKLMKKDKVTFNTVKIYNEEGDTDFILAEKIQGFSLLDWLLFLKNKYAKEGFDSTILQKLDPFESQQLEKLVEFFRPFDRAMIFDFHVAQIFYDLKKDRWVLIDWVSYKPTHYSALSGKDFVGSIWTPIHEMSETFYVLLSHQLIKKTIETPFDPLTVILDTSA